MKVIIEKTERLNLDGYDLADIGRFTKRIYGLEVKKFELILNKRTPEFIYTTSEDTLLGINIVGPCDDNGNISAHVNKIWVDGLEIFNKNDFVKIMHNVDGEYEVIMYKK